MTKLNSGSDPTYQEEYHKQYYYHGDHLGSASLISDYKGDEYQRIEYTPYGETWVEKTSNTGLEFLPYRFTAKELDKETGLYYYGARYLDPKYSRWISTDPALGEYMQGSSAGEGGAYNTVNLNLYNYGNNNPVKYSDPDGNWVHIAIGAAIGGAIGGITAACAGGSMRDVVAASVGGAVAGGLAAATCGASLGTAVAGSAMASTIGYLAENIVAGRDATVEGIAVSAAGGATGAMAGAVLEKGIGAATSKMASKLTGAEKINRVASTPVGRRGSPLEVPRGTNTPTKINGRKYTGHALDQMQGRGFVPSVVEDTINTGIKTEGNTTGTWAYTTKQAQVIVNEAGDVITAITR